MSPHLPITPDEIAAAAIAAAEAGASILHLHARDPKDGRPTPDPDVFMQFLPRIKQATDAVINITTGGGHGMTLRGAASRPRSRPRRRCRSLNMGSMNFGLSRCSSRYKEWKHAWEEQHLESTRATSSSATRSRTSSASWRSWARATARASSSSATTSATSTTLAHFLDRGLVKPPLFVQTIFGILGGIGADPENLMHMKRTADKLFGDELPVVGARPRARHQMSFATMGAAHGRQRARRAGGQPLCSARGKLATSNAEQVTRSSATS